VSATVMGRTLAYGRMIRFSHSVFALPFALAATALAARPQGVGARQVAWIVVAMVAARSAAMGFNRLADRELDARNPRTAGRELPRGVLSAQEARLFVAASAAVFVLAAWMLNPLCLALSPVALAIVLGYSYTKRFTAASHLVLGLSLALGPLGAWIAIRGRVEAAPLALAGAVVLWVAGFDTIYACQDVEFDRRHRLRSVPARFGVPTALATAQGCHVLTIAAFALLGWMMGLGWLYWLGVAVVAGLLVYEHSLVSPGDLSRLDVAFFNVNGYIAVILFLSVLAGRLA